ncbi:MAG: HNH endonuclease [Anaerolineae bacterium]|nr:HNH endonuclease [Anaerolineae bacterium]
MSRTYISVELRQIVNERADGLCEYCLVHQDDVFFPHEMDHIIAEQHGGKTISDNLALACLDCNKQKGPNIASIDPETNELVRLFNPRKDEWDDHFLFQGVEIKAKTAVGRVTIQILQLNNHYRLKQRQAIREAH